MASTTDRYRSIRNVLWVVLFLNLDLHVQVAPGTTIEEGHAIAHQVEEALRLQYGQITDVVVHLEPAARVAAPRRGEVDYREQSSSREAP